VVAGTLLYMGGGQDGRTEPQFGGKRRGAALQIWLKQPVRNYGTTLSRTSKGGAYCGLALPVAGGFLVLPVGVADACDNEKCTSRTAGGRRAVLIMY
jgi:hypothetical protein